MLHQVAIVNSLSQLSYSVINNCVDAVIIQTLAGTIVGWNPAAEQLFGYKAKEILGNSIKTLSAPGNIREEEMLLGQIVQGIAIKSLPAIRLHKKGQLLAVNITLSPILNNNGTIIGVSSIVRLADNALLEAQQLMLLAYQDHLTGLSNRIQLIDRLEQAMRRDERNAQYGAVLFIDLDHFKVVNDNNGHSVGDRILIRTARRMRSRLRRCDTIARWGGDEFIVLIEDLSDNFANAEEKAREIATKVVHFLSTPYHVKGRMYYCPPSVGVAFFCGTLQSVSTVIDNADKAMYAAKSRGGSQFIISAAKPVRPDYLRATAEADTFDNSNEVINSHVHVYKTTATQMDVDQSNNLSG